MNPEHWNFIIKIKASVNLVIFLLLNITDGFSQDVTRGNLNSWFFMYTRFQISDHIKLSNELHERTGKFLDDQGQLLIRPSIDYFLHKNVELSLGYTFIRAWSYEPYNLPIPKNENNLWEQVLLKFDIGKVHMQNRFRQEHRWINKVELIDGKYQVNGNTYKNRFRYRFVVTFDLFQIKSTDKSIFFNSFDEIWINQSGNLKPDNFVRNWLYLGIGYKIDQWTNLQIGYMNQYDKVGDNTFINSPIVQFSFIKALKL